MSGMYISNHHQATVPKTVCCHRVAVRFWWIQRNDQFAPDLSCAGTQLLIGSSVNIPTARRTVWSCLVIEKPSSAGYNWVWFMSTDWSWLWDEQRVPSRRSQSHDGRMVKLLEFQGWKSWILREHQYPWLMLTETPWADSVGKVRLK